MKSRGFTLIELLIVMAVIAILISVALPGFRGMQMEAWKTKASGEVMTLKAAVETYYMHHGNTYPPETNYQQTLMDSSPRVLPNAMNDPFGVTPTTQYVYSLDTHDPATASYYIIYSAGITRTGSAYVSTSGVVTASSEMIWSSNGHANNN